MSSAGSTLETLARGETDEQLKYCYKLPLQFDQSHHFGFRDTIKLPNFRKSVSWHHYTIAATAP